MSISSTIVDRAEIHFHAAAPALQPYVGCFWIVSAQCGSTVRLVPDGTASIAIEHQAGCVVDAYLRGPLLAPVELRFATPTTLIGVRLRPGVAFHLSGIAMHSLLDRRVHFRDYESLRQFAAIDPVLHSPAECITQLQQLLITRLQGSSLHPVVTKALAEIHSHQGSIPVAEIAARCQTSERHLTRWMRDWIGYGTKQYARIVRFQASLTHMDRSPQLPVATLATETGYFDQSHLTLDVARYAGVTPGRLISEHVSDFSKTRCDIPF